jgi:sugar diacid utilization regulator
VVAAGDYALVRLVSQGDGLQGAVEYAKRLLGPLHEHDAATGGDLALTLRVFVDSGAQVRTAAHNLDVHENTVRYRLRRIQAISAIEPERLGSLAVAQLAFQVESLATRAPAGSADI